MTNKPKCTARNSRGMPCQKAPVKGASVCATHGGSAPQVRRKAAERLELERAGLEVARQVEVWGGRLDVNPAEALLELVQGKAAEVAYWNWRVAGLSDGERAGLLVAKHEDGEGPMGPVDVTTRQPAPHVFVILLHKAQEQLASFSAAALRAGVDEALVRLATVQAGVVVDLARAAIAAARRDVSRSADDILRELVGAES